MNATLGQSVQIVKPNVSKDQSAPIWHSFAMSKATTQLTFNSAYCTRIKEMRESKGWTSEQMATALGIPAERYRKYENRSPLPPYLVERFALIVGRDVEYVLTGKSSPLKRTA